MPVSSPSGPPSLASAISWSGRGASPTSPRSRPSSKTRQSDLESLLAQRKYYDSITEQSTITVTLTSPVTADPNPLWAGLQEGWEALKASVRVLLVVLGAVLPFAAVVAIIVVPILWLVRRRARRAGTASATPAQAAPRTPTDTDPS